MRQSFSDPKLLGHLLVYTCSGVSTMKGCMVGRQTTSHILSRFDMLILYNNMIKPADKLIFPMPA